MRQPWWEWGVWFYRSSTAQANASGGNIVLDVAPLQGTTMIVTECYAINSGTNGIRMLRTDEDDTDAAVLVDIASAGQTVGTIPRTVNVITSSLLIDSTPLETRLFRADDRFTIRQTVAGAQNDTLILWLRALLSSPRRPIISKGRSINQGDVTIAAPTVDKIR